MKNYEMVGKLMEIQNNLNLLIQMNKNTIKTISAHESLSQAEEIGLHALWDTEVQLDEANELISNLIHKIFCPE